jgi:Pseudomonas avirulence D protein (AvrD)
MSSTEIFVPQVDDYLGAAEHRFFGAGYRRVRYDYRPVRLSSTRAGQAELETGLAIVYPRDWSRKTAGTDLRPHLSTVDALIAAVQSAELLLTHALGLEPLARRSLRVRTMRIKAGRVPDEELGELAVRARLLGFEREPEGFVSTVEATIGGMRVRCAVEHPSAVPAAAEADYAHPDLLLGGAEGRYYGAGFAHRAHLVHQVAADPRAGRASALVDFPGSLGAVEGAGPGEPGPLRHGIEGRWQPALGLVDCFVTSLQLGQVLLYELDGLRRGRSNTLWMRGTELRAAAEPQPLRDGARLTTRLEDSRLLERADGVWRAADIVGELGGATTRCSVAHKIT